MNMSRRYKHVLRLRIRTKTARHCANDMLKAQGTV